MTKTTTLSSFQRAMNAEIIEELEADASEQQSAPNPLAALAERMVRERSTNHAPGDPFEGMALDIDPTDAWGLVQGKVRQWVDDHGVFAQEDEIRAKTNDLWGAAQSTAPRTGTYTVGPDGLVAGYEPDAAPAELPGMPARPAVTGDVHTPLTVPSDSVFGDDGEFVMSSALSQRAQTLIARHPEHLEHLERLSVLYLWKKTGGKSKGRATFGKCTKPSGMLKHFSEAQFIVWIAADHCRAAGYRDRELEALLFHEMLHTAVTEPDENTGRGGGPALVPHELEVFRAEVEIYGLWAPELKEVGPAFQQRSLFDAQQTADPAVMAAGADLVRDLDEILDGDPNDPENYSDPMGNPPPDADAPLVCSVCGKPALDWEEELTPEEISEARQNPAVVLCEDCGEDGVLDEGDES